MTIVSVDVQVDLSLTVHERGGEISLGLSYNTALFRHETIARMGAHLRALLEAIVAAPDRRIADMPLLTERERHQLLVEWNATQASYPTNELMHEMVEAQAGRTPERIAVVHEQRQLTYGELNARANRLAHYLRTLGVKPDARVAICVERGLDMVVGLLAVLKAGGAYVPLDPGYPAERLIYMLQDSAPVAMLTDGRVPAPVQAELRAALAGRADAPVVIDFQADASAWAMQAESNPERTQVGLSAAHLAYVIYTSGSTGRPKGVAIEHRNAVNFLYWAQSSFTAEQLARTLFSTSLNFDLAMYECFAPLTVGASIQIVRNALDLVQTRHPVTLINTVPSAIQALLEAGGIPDTVRTVNLAGEPLKRALVERLFAQTDVDTVCNLYGPSETTTYSTWMAMRREQGFAPHIGRPLANTRIYLLDVHGQPVPVGVAGEMYIGGAGVARGYLNQPELTAERFVADPFANEPNARMYRTGDLARYLPDGNIEFVGRNDFQVKIRGYRIELGEVESGIARHPAIREVVVLAREDVVGDKRLVAYVVAASPAADLAEQLRAHLRARLPEYMVPSAFVMVDALPLTPNGKIDRSALPAPEYAAVEHVAPRTVTEEILAGIWAEVLKLERVGVHDDFFELGGHSLLAVSVIERMRRAGLHAEVLALFMTPTIAALAAAMGGKSDVVQVPPNAIPADCKVITPEMLPLVRLNAQEIERVVAAVPGGAGNVQDIYPLAPLQEGILFHHLMAGDGDPYLLRGLFGFDSRAVLERYVQALQSVVDRHDILRTAVLWEGLPEPVQVVWRRARLRVEEVSLDATGGDVVQQLAERFNPRRYRLDVREAPLMRLFIAHDAANARWIMLQMFHHLSIDHTTLEVVQQEIEAHLLGEAAKLPAPLPFRNFVAQARLGISREEHEAYFRKLLGDVDEPTAPFGLTDVRGDGGGIVAASRVLDVSLARRLRERARVLGVSAASVCHVAWAQVLARVSGREDVVFGTVLFGRMQSGSGADRVLGLFINTLPVRIRIGEETAEVSVRHTHEQLAQLLRHEHASLALAQRCSAVAAPAPLFSALLNYRHDTPTQTPAETLEALAGIEHLGAEERTNYPLTLSVNDLGEGFVLVAQVRAWIDPQRICGYMHTALEQLVAALENVSAAPIWSLDVVPERRQQLLDWNRTERDYPREACVAELFERQVRRAPEAVAVEYGDERLSYGELNERGNRLAHHLRSLGVGPEVLVGLCVERSAAAVVGMLGILKAGGAYVPLDPEYPAERLAFMLADTEAPVVVTQSKLLDRLPGTNARIVCLDRDWPVIEGCSAQDPASGATAENLAYVIYTSGSTGIPKGVQVTNRAINRLVCNTDYVQVGPADRFAQVSVISFDAATFEIWGALLNGARVVGVAREVSLNPQEFAVALKESGITVLFLTTALFNHMAREAPGAFKTLRYVLFGGEAVDPGAVRAVLRDDGAPRHLLHVYGPTEVTTYSTWHHVTGLDESAVTVPIGRPIANTTAYVFDEHRAPVPVGVVGELYLGGDGLARGYLKRPELTAKHFVENPFGTQAGGRLYRTGDWVRYREDGAIEFVGRRDNQVKLRGFRIELGEIEAALRRQAQVSDAVVVVREDTPGDKRLVAYVVAQGATEDLVEQLRSRLRESLPEYMVPSAFVMVEKLPLTPNGKVDRNALPAPEYAEATYVAPRTATEEILAGIWAEVLKLERVGVHDNFFELGGHSLLATQVVSRVRHAFSVELPLREMFAAPTVAQLGVCIEALRAEPRAARAVDELAWLAIGRSGSATGDREEIEL